jgi:hypothetical protein
VALAWYAGSGPDDAALWLGHVVVATLIGLGLQLAGVRGPLEAVVSVVGRAVRRGVTGVTARPVDSESPRPPGS